MQFLVTIEVTYPRDADEAVRDALVARERARAAELVSQGVIAHLWRVPGRWANVGIWEAADASELHRALTSLPFWPWLDVEVTPLADHPSNQSIDHGI